MSETHEMSEDRLIEELLKEVPLGEGAAGPGDDCAVFRRAGDQLQLLKTDAMVEAVHWTRDADPKRVGWKAVARVVSDIAAMGGSPGEFLITLAMPKSTDVAWARELYRGMGECLREHGGRIVGGETTSCPEGSSIMVSVSACGEVPADQVVLRSGAKSGDRLLVTGTLGGSISGKHLDFTPRLQEARWLCSKFKPTAMMDLSDGLSTDLPRLAKASGCGFKLNRDSIPCSEGCSVEQAMADGEDYELLFTVEPDKTQGLLDAWKHQFPELPLTEIGHFCAAADGDSLEGGWDHFA